jgi:Prokaryotic diacylglycerol kinase
MGKIHRWLRLCLRWLVVRLAHPAQHACASPDCHTCHPGEHHPAHLAVVFTAEMFNTVFELCIDLASPEYHSLAKTAKDVAAGAVLLSAILAVVIGLFVFVPHLWMLFLR